MCSVQPSKVFSIQPLLSLQLAFRCIEFLTLTHLFRAHSTSFSSRHQICIRWEPGLQQVHCVLLSVRWLPSFCTYTIFSYVLLKYSCLPVCCIILVNPKVNNDNSDNHKPFQNLLPVELWQQHLSSEQVVSHGQSWYCPNNSLNSNFGNEELLKVYMFSCKMGTNIELPSFVAFRVKCIEVY